MLFNLTGLPRNLTVGTPAKFLLILFALVFYFSFPFTSSPHSPIISAEHRANLSTASLSDLAELYDQVRHAHLERKGDFNGTAQAVTIYSPLHLPDGKSNFDPSLKAYVARLQLLTNDYFNRAPSHVHAGARNAINDLIRHQPSHSRPSIFPAKVWSTHPRGAEGVEEGFDIWHDLLQLPLSAKLVNRLSVRPLEYTEPARQGQKWDVLVTNDDGIDKWMSTWTAEKISRGIQGEGKWASIWGRLDKGVLRADLFRYMSMFAEGGIYSDSDTMPISHPYLWGLNAPSALHPDLQHLLTLINTAAPSSELASTKDRLNPRQLTTSDDEQNDQNTQQSHTSNITSDPQTYVPPYAPQRISRRAPISPLEAPCTILNPDISMIIAIEWDSCIGNNWRMWPLWSFYRLRRSWQEYGYPRALQMAQNLLVSKPFHPIMLDTLGTIAQLIEKGAAKQLAPLELTGPGPFTDAVLRYLLVQYGVTAEDLRCLRGPVQIGDIIILQEEAFHAPDHAMEKLLKHTHDLDKKVKQRKYDPWRLGVGWETWNSGGIKVAYHGLTGIWKKD